MSNLQKSKWRDKMVGDWVVVHNPVQDMEVPDHLRPWIGQKGIVTGVNTVSCAGDIFTVQMMNPLRVETFHSSELWWVKPPMTSEEKWALAQRISYLMNVIFIVYLFLRSR